jgi:predicted Zn-dependent protease
VSVHLHYVESSILDFLKDWLHDYKLEWKIGNKPKKSQAISQLDLQRKAIEKITKEIETLKKQLSNTHDLLEQGIYTVEKFQERESDLNRRIKQAEANLDTAIFEVQDEEVREESRRTIIPRVEHILEIYHELESTAAKNDLLKDVLDKVIYTKDKGGRWHNAPDDFELEIHPKLPKARK